MAAHLGLGGSSTWKSHLQRSRCSSGKPSLLPSRALQVQHCTAQPERRSANYMPNLWKHDYIESSSTTPSITENGSGGAHGLPRRVEELKEYVRLRLADEVAEPEALLELVSALGCLGVDYHFREEINALLSSLWSARITSVFSKGSLHSTALLFRLLREHYYEISQEVFDTFEGDDGSFSTHLQHDPRALLSLCESSFLAFEGEETLNKAQAFAREHLKHHLFHLQNHTLAVDVDLTLKEMIAHALELPMHWRQPRLQARWFITVQESKNTMDPLLLEFAKLDLNMVQSIHRKELMEASRWWKELGLANMLRFCRDRVVENYFCVLGGHSEPEFWYYRQCMTKIFCLIAVMDDIYDIYGTMDELEIFTDAVVRWDVNAMEGLPECMKLCFLALFNTVNEIAYSHLKEKGLDITPYLKRTWAELCKSWLVEAKWYHNKQNASFEEYMNNSWVSMGWPIDCVHGYFLVAQNTTKEALQHLESDPEVIRCSSTLIRLWNDLCTSKAELERGDILKSIQCYMHETNASEALACEHMGRLITETWKKLNRGCYESTVLGEKFLDLAMDGTRILHFIYQHGDGYARPDRETKDAIMSLLFEPI